jgi:chromosome segregation ATPase
MEDRFRRPRDELSDAEGVELAPSDEGEVVMQLSDKIRQQAKRLGALEQYRHLIEKRLRELSPAHPLPVLPMHLGKSIPDELQALRDRVEELEADQAVPMSEKFTFPHPSTQLNGPQLHELYHALYFRHHSVLKDKTALEESLRAEMLTSEEQRTYIEVLKQAIEVKMDAEGVAQQSVESFVDYSTSRSNFEQTRKDTAKLTSVIKDKEAMIKHLQGQTQQLYESLLACQEEVEQLTKAQDEAATAVLSYEDELLKVTAEKDALLEYVDEHDLSETQLKAQVSQLQEQISRFEAQSSQIAIMSRQTGETQRKTQEEVGQLKDQISKSEKSVKQLTLAVGEARSRASEQAEMLRSLREQVSSLQSKNEALQANNCTLSNTLQETQSELDTLQSTFDRSSAEQTEIKAEHTYLKAEVRRLTDLASGLQQTLQETAEVGQQRTLRLAKAEEELEVQAHLSSEQLEKERSELTSLRLTSKRLEEDRDLLKQRAAASETCYEETKKQLDEVKQALRKSEKLATSLELELEDKKALYGDLQQQYSLAATQRETLTSELLRLETDVTAHHSSALALEDENRSLRGRLEDLSRSLKLARDSLQDKETRLQKACGELGGLRAEADDLRKEAGHLHSECSAKSQELSMVKASERRLQVDSQRVESELRELRQSYMQCSRILNSFAQNFGQVSSASSVLSGILSAPFKEAISRMGSSDVTPRAVEEWLRLSVEEFEALVRRLADLKGNLQATSTQLSSLQGKLMEQEYAEDDSRDREQLLRLQLDRLLTDKAELEHENTKLQGRTDALHQEIGMLKRSVQDEAERSSKWKDQLMQLTSEIPQRRQSAEDSFSMKTLEEKVSLLVKEKKDLELILTRLQAAVPSTDLQRVFLEIMRTRGDMELTERERMRVENQLLHLEGEMRNRARANSKDAGPVRREVEALRTQLSQVNLEIHCHKRRMNELEEELQAIEVAERRRVALASDTARSHLSSREGLRENAFTPTLEDRPQLSLYEKLTQAKTTLSEIKRRAQDNY